MNNKIKATVYIIAGPNGSGKTTFAMEFLPKIAECRNFINADMIARGLSPLDVKTASIEAGRIFLKQIHEHIRQGHNFAFETTLSGLSYIKLIRNLRKTGYKICLYYLWIPTVQLTLKRITERVKRGGHHIPDDVAKRRYGKGLYNFFKYYMPQTDYCAIFDNSFIIPDLVFEKENLSETILKPFLYEKIMKQLEKK